MTDGKQSVMHREQSATDCSLSATDWEQSMTDGKQSVTHWEQSATDCSLSAIDWKQSMTWKRSVMH